MKVALVFPGSHRRAGVERVVWECARFLAGRDHEVTVFAHEWETTGDPRVHYRPVPMLRWPEFLRGLSFYRNSSRILQPQDFDVVGTHGCICPLDGVYWAHSVHAAWMERNRSTHGFRSWQSVLHRLNPLHPILYRLEEKHFRERRYRKILALTETVKHNLGLHYGVPAEDVVVNPNGFSPEEFNPERRAAGRAAARAEWGLKDGQTALLFVANELPRKGYLTLLRALRQLRRPDLRLLVVGKPEKALVKRMAAEEGVADQVIACGATRDVASLHAAADLFVLPTQYEAFCLSILESLGSGLPVVTTRISGAQDAIQPGVNGALITDPCNATELAETISPLLERSVLEGISAQTPATVSSYQWSNVLLCYEQILRDHCQ